MHPLDQLREGARQLFLECYNKCDISHTCDVIMKDYPIPAPMRCADCTEVFYECIKGYGKLHTDEKDKVRIGA